MNTSQKELDIKLFMTHHMPPHKNFKEDISPYITHIQSGRELSKSPLNFIGDNTGDNISRLNPSFGELSVHYWVWKNKTDFDVIGFQHYRRIFNLNNAFSSQQNQYTLSNFYYNWAIKKCLSQRNLQDYTQKYDLIIPAPVDLKPLNIETQYKLAHLSKDWDLLMTTLEKKLTAKYKKYVSPFLQDNQLYSCILYIAHKQVFNDMMTWLFDILFDVHDQIKPNNDPYQSRSIAFLAERLLHLYYFQAIKEQKIRVGTCNFLVFDNKPGRIEDFFRLLI